MKYPRLRPSNLHNSNPHRSHHRLPIIDISDGTFYRNHPSSRLRNQNSNPPLFPDLKFSLFAFSSPPRNWAIIGPSSSGKTTFLQILRGKHFSLYPHSRSWPYLSSPEIAEKSPRFRSVESAIQYVGFDAEQTGTGASGQAPQSAYLSARYESRRESTDFSLRDYLLGNTELNPLQDIHNARVEPRVLEKVVRDLRLGDLLDMPVSNLSNGQSRRARIAKALLGDPEVLLLDEPFMGLDPPTLLTLSPLLEELTKLRKPRLILSLRPQDPIPDWITHVMYLKGNCEIGFKGKKEDVLEVLKGLAWRNKGNRGVNADPMLSSLSEVGKILTSKGIVGSNLESELQSISSETAHLGGSSAQSSQQMSRDGYPLHDSTPRSITEPLVEMQGAVVSYTGKTVLGNWTQQVDGTEREGLWWTVRRGERWGIFGPNGSGKTTILSLICSDHPQTYSLPIKLFGRPRIPEPGQKGTSIFDIQARIGHSSPEIHSHIPRSLTLRQVLENAWADTFKGVPKLDRSAKQRIDAALRWFKQDLKTGGAEHPVGLVDTTTKWSDNIFFGGLPFSSQKVALFLRAVIKQPELVILDEAFSGMDDRVRDRCLLFLAHGETKQFGEDATSSHKSGKASIIESKVSQMGNVKITGLTDEQALLCISHVQEEIPGSIREWICLPEANTGKPARFGKLKGPIEGSYERWNEIWDM